MAMDQSTVHETRSKVLYHYTTPEGLLGIFKHSAIWATDILYLNDSEEFLGALDLMTKIIDEEWPKYSGPWKLARKIVEGGPSAKSTVGTFVTSFSAKENSLEQWRAYGGRDGGFSIGFYKNSLEALGPNCEFNLRKCLYRDDEKAELVRSTLKTEIEEGESNRQALQEMMIDLGTHALLIAPILKNRAFENEEEWRLVSAPITLDDRKIEFCHRHAMLIPYINVILGKPDRQGADPDGKAVQADGRAAPSDPNLHLLPVRDVWIAPTPNSNLAERSLKALLAGRLERPERDSSAPIAIPSGIPYRTW